jgi:4-hydroxy-2-oxoheptanedioate aldolase
MPNDRVRERWDAGGVALNAWLLHDGAAAAASVAAAGFDSVTVDLQHGWSTETSLASVCAAIEATGSVPMARLAWNEPARVMRALDLGVRGVIAPMVDSRDDAESLVAAARYPPAGTRSYGPVAGAFATGPAQVRAAAERTLVIAMIETAEGFANVQEIASTPGLDALYVGPADLSLGLGLPSFADFGDPALIDKLDAVVAAAERSGIVAGVHAPSPASSVAMAERGFRFVTPAVDADLLTSGAAAALEATRSRLS